MNQIPGNIRGFDDPVLMKLWEGVKNKTVSVDKFKERLLWNYEKHQ